MLINIVRWNYTVTRLSRMRGDSVLGAGGHRSICSTHMLLQVKAGLTAEDHTQPTYISARSLNPQQPVPKIPRLEHKRLSAIK